MLFAFSVAPSGSGDSLAAAVADAVAIVRESGLPNHTDSMFTTIEGEWDECMDVIRRACEAVGRHGNRVSLVLKADIRPGHAGGELTAKVERLEAALTELHDRETSRSTSTTTGASTTGASTIGASSGAGSTSGTGSSSGTGTTSGTSKGQDGPVTGEAPVATD